MKRSTGAYIISTTQGEPVRAFVPHPLPPTHPELAPEAYAALNLQAELALARLSGVSGLWWSCQDSLIIWQAVPNVRSTPRLQESK